MMSKETKNPQKTIPRALILCFVVTFVLYIFIGIIEVGIVYWKLWEMMHILLEQ